MVLLLRFGYPAWYPHAEVALVSSTAIMVSLLHAIASVSLLHLLLPAWL